MTSTGQLRDLLAKFFIASAAAVTRHFERHDVPLKIFEPRAIPFRIANSWGISESSKSINVLASEDFWMRYKTPVLSRNMVRNARALGDSLAETASDMLPFSESFQYDNLMLGPRLRSSGVPDFISEPGVWITRRIVLPALQAHLVSLPSVDKADSPAAFAFADEVLKVVHDDHYHYCEFAPLSGLDTTSAMAGPIGKDGIAFRRLTNDELSAWLENSRFRRDLMSEDPPTLAVEVRTVTPRRDSAPEWHHNVPTVVAALELNGFKIAGEFTTIRVEPNWMYPVISRKALTLPPAVGGKLAPFTQGEFRSFATTLALLKKFSIEEPRMVTDLSLHRFVSGCARSVPADALIDFTITLESLFLPYDEAARHGDLSYRFRIHGSHYLTETSVDRRDMFAKLRRIYDMRSRLVHGAGYPSKAETIEVRDIAYDLARRGLLRAVTDGFPTAEAFNAMALGARRDSAHG